LPVIGLGTWPVFDVGADQPTRRRLREVVRRLVDGGARMIDTSPMYGRAEAVTGDLVAELGVRERTFLATKVWTTGRDAGIAEIERSARRLRSAVIDLVQIHNRVDWRTLLVTLRRMPTAASAISASPITPSGHSPIWPPFSTPNPISILSNAAIRPQPHRPNSGSCR
jgi:diketogulonate reductase-like aldo/keto reductase